MRPLRLFLVMVFLCAGVQEAYAARSFRKFDSRASLSQKNLREYADASWKNIRFIQQKQLLQMEAEKGNSKRKGRAVEAGSAASAEGSALLLEAAPEEAPVFALRLAPTNAEAEQIYAELQRNQQASPLGLLTSYTGQRGLENQGFTYDQALAGLAMLAQDDTAGAQRILDFFRLAWNGTGLSTVYNTQIPGGPTIEQERVLGPNAWVSLFAVQYSLKTGDAAALDFAATIAEWALTLPQTSGGIAMGRAGTHWATLYSVENNLSFYAALKLLTENGTALPQLAVLTAARDDLKEWLVHPGYAFSEGLFRRGGYLDSLKALDTSAWGILAFGVDGLREMGIDADALVSAIENEFMVNDLEGYGSYGGDPLTAKGFDFSSSTNAFLARRSAVKWVEGTTQMITVYRTLARYYSQAATLDLEKVSSYTERADHFAALNGNDRLLTDGGSSYSYSDSPNAQVFFDVPAWRTASGPSVAAAAWVYYSLYGFNPFERIPS
jgi:hypothetical protein